MMNEKLISCLDNGGSFQQTAGVNNEEMDTRL